MVSDTIHDWILGRTDKGAAEGKGCAREGLVDSNSAQVDRDPGPADADASTTSPVAGGSCPTGDVAAASPGVFVDCYCSWWNTVHAADAPAATIEAAYCAV